MENHLLIDRYIVELKEIGVDGWLLYGQKFPIKLCEKTLYLL